MTIHPSLARAAGIGAAGAVALGALAFVSEADAQDAGRAPNAVADLVERVSPAVVTVLAERPTPDARAELPFGEDSPFGEFFRRFGPPRGMPSPDREGPRRTGLGSGFVLESDGYIVTNEHVVDGADSVSIRFSDGESYDADVIGVDAETDLALLKIDADDLPSVTLGDSDGIRVGEDVIAVGNPFGLGGTVTSGIVSALGRDIRQGAYVDFIQTDAAINRGNSGGPLFNMEGEVIGVNSAIFSPTGGSVGVGFAIPANIVRDVVADLKDDGVVERGWLGVMIQGVTPELAEALGLDAAEGALVADVVDGGPSDGLLRAGDVVIGFDGQDVEQSRDLPRLVGAAAAGEEVDVTVIRDGARETLTIEIGLRDSEERVAAADVEDDGGDARLGATLAPLDRETRGRLGLGPEVEGAVVTSLMDGGAAAEAGLRVGDVVLRVGETAISAPEDVVAALEDVDRGSVLIQVARGDARIFVGVPLG